MENVRFDRFNCPEAKKRDLLNIIFIYFSQLKPAKLLKGGNDLGVLYQSFDEMIKVFAADKIFCQSLVLNPFLTPDRRMILVSEGSVKIIDFLAVLD